MDRQTDRRTNGRMDPSSKDPAGKAGDPIITDCKLKVKLFNKYFLAHLIALFPHSPIFFIYFEDSYMNPWK